MAIATMEWMKILIMIITVSSGVAAPFIYIWKRNIKDQESRDKKIEDLVTKTHQQEVDIAGLKNGKVSHTELQETVRQMETSTQHKFEALHNKMDINLQKSREDLSHEVRDLKDYFKEIMAANKNN